MKKLAVLFIVMVTLVGCTANERARNFGGTVSYDIDKGQKVVNVTWKEGDVWILTRPMREGEQPETWSFFEKNSYGWKSGEVLLKESK